MTFEEWWDQGGRGNLVFHPDVKRYAKKAWEAALDSAQGTITKLRLDLDEALTQHGEAQ